MPPETSTVLHEGDPAPAFDLPAHPQGRVTLAEFRGKKNVLLAFYPEDDTPDCTREMCGFSTDIGPFASANTAVLGISCDNVTRHAAFAAKYGLSVVLLADEDCAVGRAYGAVRGGGRGGPHPLRHRQAGRHSPYSSGHAGQCRSAGGRARAGVNALRHPFDPQGTPAQRGRHHDRSPPPARLAARGFTP